jgi:hypothetical protein
VEGKRRRRKRDRERQRTEVKKPMREEERD